VRALADFAHLNAAARECVTQMGVRDKALPAALRADFSRGADRAAVKCAWECEALADAVVPAARQLGIDAAPVELLIAFRDVGNLPSSWSLATPLARWAGVKVSDQGNVAKIALSDKNLTGHVDLIQLPASLTWLDVNQNKLSGAVDLTKLPAALTDLFLSDNRLTGAVDLTKLPPSLEKLMLGWNQLTGPVDLTQLPRSLWMLGLEHNAGLTGAWRGEKPTDFDFRDTGITVDGCVIA
jgi:hypothetical protein